MPGCLHLPQTHSSVGWDRRNPSLRGSKALSWGQHPSSHLECPVKSLALGSVWESGSLLLWALFGRAVHSYVLIVSVLFCYLYSIKMLKQKRKKKKKEEKERKKPEKSAQYG